MVEGVKLTDVTLKPLLHGAAQGGISTLDGGDFSQGFLSGMLSSVSGSVTSALGSIDNVFLESFAKGIVGAASGAAGAAIANGDIVQGAIQGTFEFSSSLS